MMKIIKGLVIISTLAYPFLVVLKSNLVAYLATILAILWGIRAILEKRIFIIISLFFILLIFVNDVKFLYPVIINLIFAFTFIGSLKGEAIITKFAKLRNKNLPQKAVSYTRNLTKLWGVFFIANALFSLTLWFISEHWWLLYCGIINHILVGVLFMIEFIYRKLFIKNDK